MKRLPSDDHHRQSFGAWRSLRAPKGPRTPAAPRILRKAVLPLERPPPEAAAKPGKHPLLFSSPSNSAKYSSRDTEPRMAADLESDICRTSPSGIVSGTLSGAGAFPFPLNELTTINTMPTISIAARPIKVHIVFLSTAITQHKLYTNTRWPSPPSPPRRHTRPGVPISNPFSSLSGLYQIIGNHLETLNQQAVRIGVAPPPFYHLAGAHEGV